MTTDLGHLPSQQGDAVRRAVRAGRAVGRPDGDVDRHLAVLAAEYAATTHRRVVVLGMRVLGPLCLALVVASSWTLTRDGDDLDFGASLGIGVATFTLFGAVLWAVVLRPLVAARRANLRAAGRSGTAPVGRDGAHWTLAWIAAWCVASVVGAGFSALGVTVAGSVAFAAWVTTLWITKRAIDTVVIGDELTPSGTAPGGA
ncbi:MAG: hypothetical protein S0880_30755 [Actinomycetota bacterium]|nr:hypothetical protein [Actinomycetota bacterium]